MTYRERGRLIASIRRVRTRIARELVIRETADVPALSLAGA